MAIGWLVEPMARTPWTGFWMLIGGKVALWSAAYVLVGMQRSRKDASRLYGRLWWLLAAGVHLTIIGFIWMLAAALWSVWLLVMLTIIPIIFVSLEALAYRATAQSWQDEPKRVSLSKDVDS